MGVSFEPSVSYSSIRSRNVKALFTETKCLQPSSQIIITVALIPGRDTATQQTHLFMCKSSVNPRNCQRPEFNIYNNYMDPELRIVRP